MTKLHSHYESLNVTRDAPPEVIRAAYRSLSQKHHPDKNSGNHHAEQMMARLNAAYSVLSDADQRELYDLQILSEQRAREMHFGVHSTVDLSDPTVVYTPFDMDESGRASRPAPGTSARKPGKSMDAWLAFIHKHAQGRSVRNTALLIGFLFVAIALVLWLVWKDNQSMMRLEQAAMYAPAPEPLAPATSNDAKTKSSGVREIQVSGPSGLGVDSAEIPKPAAAPKAPPAPAPASKASEYERLTAMLKSMGLGLHKLDVPAQASTAKQPPLPAKAAEPAKAVEAPKASAAPPAPALAAKPAPAPEAVREAERPVAAEPARSEAKPVADASRASAPPAASTNTASASRAAPRTAVIVDARACVPPKYPANSYLSGESGSVLLALLVGNDGRVLESKVQKSSGFPDLDKAARKALAQCKFKPAGSDGQGEPVWATMTYVWSLD
ncbi:MULTISPECIES: TonB family protein [unclassified Duganella]|uniref:TonB family protein n=1 Tax=unclassified Duganella TaxID=2636909 RepID=UPI000E357021|nr:MULTISPECIES: TonB family protein [unclassified Duganella]RFP08894.1 TonB family protein [Duganella sp. BJB475]RFP23996.1 TonB family protein [Duganella sp. BJB476]